MALFITDNAFDAQLDYIINAAEQLVVCAGQPTSYADATTDSGSGGNALGETAITSGDFTKADGDTDGRKFTVAAQADIDVDVSGTADHIAIVDNTGTELLLVTDMTGQAVSSGGTMSTQAFDHTARDASAP